MKMLRQAAALMLAVALLLSSAALAESLENTFPLPQLVPVELSKDVTPLLLEKNQNYYAAGAGFSEDGLSYHDDSLDIRIHKIRAYDTPVAVAFIQIADASQFRTRSAKPYPSQATTHIMALAKNVRAIFCTNADWFVYHNAGVIYRQGKLLRNRPNEEYDGLFVDMNGDFHIVAPLTQEGVDAIEEPILNSFCFGPALVIDGEVCEIVREETFRQRTAIGQIDERSYVLVVTDGPMEKDSVGLNVPSLAQLMHDLGAKQAYNLDGGNSSTMLFNFTKINGQKAAKLRDMGDILYFATAIPDNEP